MQTCNVVVRFGRVGLLVLALAAPAAADGQVLVVAPVAGPGIDFTELDDAVAAATDGDTILIHAGTYGEVFGDPVTVTNESLAIAARPGELVTINASFEVLGLTADKFVSLTGLKLVGGLVLENDAGPVWIENCTINGQWALAFFPTPVLHAGDGVEVSDCANVTIAGTSITGGSANNPGGTAHGGHGLVSSNSNVWLFDANLTGGSAQACFDLCAKIPGNGISSFAGQLYAEGSAIKGLRGIFLHESTVLWLMDTDITSTGGGGTYPLIDGDGTVTELAGVERDFSINTPVEEQDTLTISFTGLEGDSAMILAAHLPGGVMSAYLHGPLLAPPLLVFPVGVLPAGGALTVPLVVPALSPGLLTLDAVLQGAFVASGGGGVFLSDPSRLIILGAEF